MDPPWLQGGNGYFATALGYIENKSESRSREGSLFLLVEFDGILEFQGLSGKYGLLGLRYTDQVWEVQGTVHIFLLKTKINAIEEISKDSSRWMESHAWYEIIKD